MTKLPNPPLDISKLTSRLTPALKLDKSCVSRETDDKLIRTVAAGQFSLMSLETHKKNRFNVNVFVYQTGSSALVREFAKLLKLASRPRELISFAILFLCLANVFASL